MRTYLLGSAITIGLAAACLGGAMPAKADVVSFSFDGLTGGTGTPFTLTAGGISATFTASGDRGGFQITSSFFSFPGNVVYTPGTSGQVNEALDIAFSTPIGSFTGLFATNGVGPLDLIALTGGLGGTVVGSSSATGSAVVSFPEGTITYTGDPVDTIVLSDPTDPNFALGSFTVTTVPEPSSIGLFGAATLGIGALFRLKGKERPQA